MSELHFAYPSALFLLALVPVLSWLYLRSRSAAISFPQTATLKRLPKGGSRRARFFGMLLRSVGFSALIIAVSGPRWPDEGSRIPTEGVAIAIVLDVSGSMAEKDFHWHDKKISRLQATQLVFRLFVKGGKGPNDRYFGGRAHDLLALVVFATRPETVCPLTLNHTVLLELMDKQQPRSVPGESKTNIGDAIVLGLDSLVESGHKNRILLLLSDGEHNVDKPALKPSQAAQLAGNYGVPIFVIDAGKETTQSSKSGEAKTDRKRARQILQQVARISKGGEYFEANDTESLVKVSREIDALVKQKILSYHYQRYYEGFGWFALAAFVILVTIHLLEWTIWRRIP